MQRIFGLALGIMCCCAAGHVVAATLYVDGQISPASTTAYNPATRAATGGTATCYKTLAGASGAAQAGDSVLVRAGTYAETLTPTRSGTAAQPITYARYGTEDAIISGNLTPAIIISNRSYLVMDGLKIQNVVRWMYALNAHHNVIKNCTFLKATDSGGSSKTGLFFQDATYNRLLNNRIEDSTQDNLTLIRSDRNLIEGNTILKAKHTLWTIKAGNFNVLRNNYFHNQIQKIGEIYDADGVGFDHEITALNATKRNVVEGNEFAFTASSGNASPYAGIQYAGQQGIIRRNRFYDCIGPALDLTQYANEAQYNTDNRVYHNVFTKSAFAGVSLAGSSTNFSGNIFKNNILAKSRFVANDTRWPWYTDTLNGKYMQLLAGGLNGFFFTGNSFYGSTGNDELYVITNGRRDSSSNPAPHGLSWWQANHPALFAGNIEREPQWVNEAGHDYHLRAGSPMIDAGVFLTTTAAAGSGTQLTVADASYFCDGFGIPGLTGDVIQLEGQTETATITAVNYATNTLTLSRSLTWMAGKGVALAFAGTKPDLGAFEYLAANTPPQIDSFPWANPNPTIVR